MLLTIPTTLPAATFSAYYIGLDFIDANTPSPPTFIWDFEPYPLTTPSNYFVTQGGLAGWTEDDARRAVAIAVEDAFYSIDVGDPDRVVRMNFYLGSVSTSLVGQRLNLMLGQSSEPSLSFLGETVALFDNPLSTDAYVAAAYVDEIDKLGNGFVTYDTAEGAINAIAGTAAHEIGHVFGAVHVATFPGDPDPLPIMSIFSTGLAWTDRLEERRFSTTLPAGTSNASTLFQSAGTVHRGDLNLDGVVNAVDAAAMFSQWSSENLLRYEGDVNGDHKSNAIDASIMFSGWTLDPGPAGVGQAIAEYDPATGEIIVSIEGVNNWFVQSASGSLTGDEPSFTTIVPGSFLSNDDDLIGETGFSTAMATDVSLGNVAALGLAIGDLTISWNAGLGSATQTIDVVVIPEPATLALAAFGLCGVLATRSRRQQSIV